MNAVLRAAPEAGIRWRASAPGRTLFYTEKLRSRFEIRSW